MQIFMQTIPEQGKVPRFYHLFLQPDLLGGWSLVREWGYQGSSGKIRKDYYAQREEAERQLASLRDTQINRGFRVVFAQGETRPEE